jgi:hypothetical protein
MTVACTINFLFRAYLTILAKANANLALPVIVNYDYKVHRKLKCTFRIVSYDRETFVVYETGPFTVKRTHSI